jgi:DNA-binding transcriptional ArsR family regulator
MNIKALSKLKIGAKKSATLLKALAHPERLLILCQLVDSEKNVGELLIHSGLSQSACSQHLGVLRRKKIVETRKEMQLVYYRLVDVPTLKVLQLLHDIYC